MRLSLPHPLVLLVGGVVIAAALTWALPAGQYERREDPATGRTVVVAGTYHRVPPAPVGPFATIVALPRGLAEAVDVIGVILFVGGAWVVLDKLGALRRIVGGMVARFHGRGLWAIPVVAAFFAFAGAMENMQEEIIPLVPVLILLGRGLGTNALAMVAASAGAAMVGSAFGPTNPFQAGIALKLAQLAPFSAGGLRVAMLVAGFVVWVAWTMYYAERQKAASTPQSTAASTPQSTAASTPQSAPPSRRDWTLLAITVAPMALYVYGALELGWGFNELSAGFIVAGVLVGVLGGLGVRGTVETYLEGMQALIPAALIVSVARSISLVLADGKVIDTILQSLSAPLAHVPAFGAALLMLPVHFLVHIVVPSVSGQAVLTLPVFVPLSDLLGISRQVTVLAYQTGAGLTELLSPTNGALMAILLAAGVPYGKWLRFAAIGVALLTVVGVAGMMLAQR